MSDNVPTIVKPVPRRPFEFKITPASIENSRPTSPVSRRQLDLLNSLASSSGNDATPKDSISRAASLINLTSSTLSGIYGPTEEPETPWGLGAQTPTTQFTLQDQQDFSAIELNKEHSSMLRRRLSSTTRTPPRELLRQKPRSIASLLPRAGLLFVLGMGYGFLVTQLSDGQKYQQHPWYQSRKAMSWGYLIFCGVIGVVLGGLLPWFDGVWEKAFGAATSEVVDPDPVIAIEKRNREKVMIKIKPSTDWVLVVRGVGAFVGIAFAIRRLPWTSSFQASATLALVNPFLWYLIDRSKPGILLSSVVAFVGSAILLSLSPQMMPPAGPSATINKPHHVNSSFVGQSNSGNLVILGGIASQGIVERGVWMATLLFCTCVCFGNIGRRLEWQRGAELRGRWGGVR